MEDCLNSLHHRPVHPLKNGRKKRKFGFNDISLFTKSPGTCRVVFGGTFAHNLSAQGVTPTLSAPEYLGR